MPDLPIPRSKNCLAKMPDWFAGNTNRVSGARSRARCKNGAKSGLATGIRNDSMTSAAIWGGCHDHRSTIRRSLSCTIHAHRQCQLRQGRNFIDTPAGSVAIINPFQPFTKTWLPGTRQLFLRIDRDLIEREFCALTHSDETERIEFDPLPQEHMARAGTLAHLAQMLCDDLKNDSSELLHPLIRGRIASMLVSTLLVSMPHNRLRALEAAARSVAPFFVRRAEQRG